MKDDIEDIDLNSINKNKKEKMIYPKEQKLAFI